MNKKIKKILIIAILAILLLLFFYSSVQGAWNFNPGDSKWKPQNQIAAQGADKLGKIGNNIVAIANYIVSGIAVIVFLILGIKYMMGSVEEKAKYKETLVPYIIGAIAVFSITNILSIIIQIVQKIF